MYSYIHYWFLSNPFDLILPAPPTSTPRDMASSLERCRCSRRLRDKVPTSWINGKRYAALCRTKDGNGKCI